LIFKKHKKACELAAAIALAFVASNITVPCSVAFAAGGGTIHSKEEDQIISKQKQKTVEQMKKNAVNAVSTESVMVIPDPKKKEEWSNHSVIEKNTYDVDIPVSDITEKE